MSSKKFRNTGTEPSKSCWTPLHSVKNKYVDNGGGGGGGGDWPPPKLSGSGEGKMIRCIPFHLCV